MIGLALGVLSNRYVLIAVAIAVVAGGAYWKGLQAGKVQGLKDTVQAYKNREQVDENINRLGAYDLCIELGGLPEQCAELRGVDSGAPAE